MSKKIIVWLLIPFFCVGCLRRVAIPPETRDIKSLSDIVYVHMKPDKWFENDTLLVVKNPKNDGAFLSGISENENIQVPITDIDKIETVHFDKTKVLIGSAVFAVFMAYGAMYARGLAALKEDQEPFGE